MEFEGDWWTNPWMVLFFVIAAVPTFVGLGGVAYFARSGWTHGWTATKIGGTVLAVGWSIWWAMDWWGRATDPRFHS